ncbi:MAG: hypothetical protein GDA40_06330 [Rhodobacteraceae bacterium]|nr:hypothetical protein [Paracoccaceae bacterium]
MIRDGMCAGAAGAPYAALVGQRIKVAMRRNGLDGKMPALRCDLFALPLGDAAQPSLFWSLPRGAGPA